MSGWWIPMAISAVGSLISHDDTEDQIETQHDWNNYNADYQRAIDLNNIASMRALGEINKGISEFNAGLQLAAGDYALERSMMSAEMVDMSTDFNIAMIDAVAMYNDSLLAAEEEELWDNYDLNVELLRQQRLVERGAIAAQQAASGTVMGQGSNADVMVSSMTQQALDEFVLRYEADQKAAEISNSRAQGMWEANMATKKLIYEGGLKSAGYFLEGVDQWYSSRLNALATLAGGELSAAQTEIQAAAAETSSELAYQSSIAQGAMSASQASDANDNNLISGLFGAASVGASTYFSQKSADPTGSGGSLFDFFDDLF